MAIPRRCQAAHERRLARAARPAQPPKVAGLRAVEDVGDHCPYSDAAQRLSVEGNRVDLAGAERGRRLRLPDRRGFLHESGLCW
jgi:hypothetical protein